MSKIFCRIIIVQFLIHAASAKVRAIWHHKKYNYKLLILNMYVYFPNTQSWEEEKSSLLTKQEEKSEYGKNKGQAQHANYTSGIPSPHHGIPMFGTEE